MFIKNSIEESCVFPLKLTEMWVANKHKKNVQYR